MEETKSIWDGWEKQFRCGSNPCGDVRHGDDCALTYVEQSILSTTSAHQGTIKRVVREIKRRYQVPADQELEFNDYAVIAWANNELMLTPEDFRKLDRETQIAEALESLENQSPAGEKANLKVEDEVGVCR